MFARAMRTQSAAVVAGLIVACGAAQARSLQLVGTAGYLSEWQVSALVSEGSSGDALVGHISWKHIGLCTVNGPVEKTGEIRLKISGWGPLSRIDATMSFEQAQCTYSGSFRDGTKGTMDCTDARGIPLTLSVK
jgi:hypothetical protein